MLKRLQVYYSGQVQGVGFRYTARSIAQGLGLTGWVKNLADDRVEVVAEGKEADLKEFLKQIKDELNYTHFKESIIWGTAGNDFKTFEVMY